MSSGWFILRRRIAESSLRFSEILFESRLVGASAFICTYFTAAVHVYGLNIRSFFPHNIASNEIDIIFDELKANMHTALK